MWIERLTTSRTTRALELAAQFAEHRQRVLAENVANVDTPNYTTRRLDVGPFQRSLAKALAAGRERSDARLELRGNAQFSTGADGRVSARPTVVPAQNILFQDGTNVRLEQLMTDVAQNSLSQELSTTLLRGKLEMLMRAIRGRTA